MQANENDDVAATTMKEFAEASSCLSICAECLPPKLGFGAIHYSTKPARYLNDSVPEPPDSRRAWVMPSCQNLIFSKRQGQHLAYEGSCSQHVANMFQHQQIVCRLKIVLHVD